MQIHFMPVGMYIVRVQEPDKSEMQMLFESSYSHYDLTVLIVFKWYTPSSIYLHSSVSYSRCHIRNLNLSDYGLLTTVCLKLMRAKA